MWCAVLCAVPHTPHDACMQEPLDDASHEAMMQEVLQDYMQKAEAYRTDLGDKRLTFEHMLLAMAEVRAAAAAAATVMATALAGKAAAAAV